MSGRFEGERAVVVGAGVAGTAAAAVLRLEGAEVRITEARPLAQLGALAELRSLGCDVLAGGHDRSHLEGATLVVTGPGVPEGAAVLRWARERDIPVWGEMELGARLVQVPYLAVTGTNGKTTTTGMITSMLRAGGVDAISCGNIGHPFPTAALEQHDVLVVECSSFQLRLQKSMHPRVSVLLNLAPDHLDWHGSFEAYAQAKASIFANQRGDDVHVGSSDDASAAERSASAPCRVVWTTTAEPGESEVGYDGSTLVSRLPDADGAIGPVDDGRAGYRANAAAAAAAALSFGVDRQAVRSGLETFEPLAHRGETVATIEGVAFIDDSKATNVHAALAAIERVHDAVLIAGGLAKGVDLSGLAAGASRLSAVVAIGDAAGEIARVFHDIVPVHGASSVEAAVRDAFELARPAHVPVLLAPACASWDQFSGYVERGERFVAAARSLEGVRTGDRS